MADMSMTAAAAAPRPLLRRVLSFREPLLLIPYLAGFIAAAASAFFHSYASFLQSFARSLVVVVPTAAASKCASSSSSSSRAARCCCDDHAVVGEEEEEEEEEVAVSKEEVEAILERMGLGAAGGGEGLAACVGHADVSRLFDAEEPSFAELRRAFAVFDGDADGFIDAADLQGALAKLGCREDAAACGAMIAASCGGSSDGRMSLFQFVRFLETGLCC